LTPDLNTVVSLISTISTFRYTQWSGTKPAPTHIV